MSKLITISDEVKDVEKAEWKKSIDKVLLYDKFSIRKIDFINLNSIMVKDKDTINMINDYAVSIINKYINEGDIEILYSSHYIIIKDISIGVLPFIPLADSNVYIYSRWNVYHNDVLLGGPYLIGKVTYNGFPRNYAIGINTDFVEWGSTRYKEEKY